MILISKRQILLFLEGSFAFDCGDPICRQAAESSYRADPVLGSGDFGIFSQKVFDHLHLPEHLFTTKYRYLIIVNEMSYLRPGYDL
jgi:hypothetical protein